MNHEMIEKIVNAIKQNCVSDFENYLQIHEVKLRQALASLPEPEIDLNEAWISVEDRLPDVGVEVMAYTSQRVFEFCYIDADGEWEGDLRGTKDNPELVTHWQPLAAPPLSHLETKEGRG